MNAARKSESPACPVSFALEIFGDRWTLLVLRDILLKERHTYKDILAANQGMATSVLADRLNRLVLRGLVSKERLETDARQFIYRATELGVSVIPMLAEMITWGARHGSADVDPSFTRRFDTDRENLIEELQTRAREAAGLPR